MRETCEARIRHARLERGRLAALTRLVSECTGIVRAALELRREATPVPPPPAFAPAGPLAALHAVGFEARIAVRSLLGSPGFTTVAVWTLATGIAGSLAIFTIVHGVLLQPLPFREPARLVALWESNEERGWVHAHVAAANYLDWRESSETLEAIAAHNDWLDELVAVREGQPTVVSGNGVTGNFFEVLGVAPLHGRLFDDGHTFRGTEPSVVLSHDFWVREHSADPGVIGTTLTLDDVPRRVLAVMPEGFRFPYREVDVWLPVAWSPEDRPRLWFRRAHGLRAIGRLAPGASVTAASAELEEIARRLERNYPETNEGMGAGATSLHEWIVGDSRRALSILQASMALVLLIACANVSNLLLARQSRRARAYQVRGALGGSRLRLAAQPFLEALALTFAGGAIGIAAGAAVSRALVHYSPVSLPRADEVALTPPVVGTAVVFVGVLALLFGASSAWRAFAASATSSPGLASRRTTLRTSKVIVALEVALSVPLAMGAALMMQTVDRLADVDPGFDPENVVVARVMLPSPRYGSEQELASFHARLHAELVDTVGPSVAFSSRLPFFDQRWTSAFTVEGWTSETYGLGVRHDEISPRLFETMGVPLLAGRDFEPSDTRAGPPVVVINRALADRYFPDESPLGKRIAFDQVPGPTRCGARS